MLNPIETTKRPVSSSNVFNQRSVNSPLDKQLEHISESLRIDLQETTNTSSKGSLSLLDKVNNGIQRFSKNISEVAQKLMRANPIAQNGRQQLIEQYAESPFEQILFKMSRPTNWQETWPVTNAWAEGILSKDDTTRDAALGLLRNFLNYNRLESQQKLSSHTQLKMLYFAPQLDEGINARALLYENVFKLHPKHSYDLLENLSEDFGKLPILNQLRILKQLNQVITNHQAELSPENLGQWQQGLKQLVIQFYSNQANLQNVDLQNLMILQDKVRLGFLKMQPIEEAYRKAVEETDRRYRMRIRQLKRLRQNLLNQAEGDRQKHIQLVYEDIESALLNGLAQEELPV